MWKLRVAGASCSQIAKQVGVSAMTVSLDLRTMIEASRTRTAESVEHYIELQKARCEAMLLAAWPQIQKGETASLQAGVRILERLANLLGLDAPKRTELTGPGGGPIQNQHAMTLTTAPTEEVLRRLREAVAAVAPAEDVVGRAGTPTPTTAGEATGLARAYLDELAGRNGGTAGGNGGG